LKELPPVRGNQERFLAYPQSLKVDKSTTAERHEEEEMRNELLKGFSMLVLVIALAAATATATSNAQPPSRVVANIPFEFSVGYKTMPAGEYQIQIVTSANDALLIQSADAKTSALRLSEATKRMKNKQVRLVFHRYGERYFLAEVWNGDDTGRQLLRSQEEKAIERELASIASTSDEKHATYEIVEVVASLR
jgi:hypothetical protein